MDSMYDIQTYSLFYSQNLSLVNQSKLAGHLMFLLTQKIFSKFARRFDESLE